MNTRLPIKYQSHDIVAVPDTRVLGKDMAGAFLILFLFLLFVRIVLTPEILRLFNAGKVSQDITAWMAFWGSVLLAGLLFAFPLFLIIQGIAYYQDARVLDRMGTLTKGFIVDKRMDVLDGKPAYYVQYEYFLGLTALQTVTKDVFQQLTCDQSIDVLHLEHAPQVSRLVLNSLP